VRCPFLPCPSAFVLRRAIAPNSPSSDTLGGLSTLLSTPLESCCSTSHSPLSGLPSLPTKGARVVDAVSEKEAAPKSFTHHLLLPPPRHHQHRVHPERKGRPPHPEACRFPSVLQHHHSLFTRRHSHPSHPSHLPLERRLPSTPLSTSAATFSCQYAPASSLGSSHLLPLSPA
jgi:hypothetical protein